MSNSTLNFHRRLDGETTIVSRWAHTTATFQLTHVMAYAVERTGEVVRFAVLLASGQALEFVQTDWAPELEAVLRRWLTARQSPPTTSSYGEIEDKE